MFRLNLQETINIIIRIIIFKISRVLKVVALKDYLLLVRHKKKCTVIKDKVHINIIKLEIREIENDQKN